MGGDFSQKALTKFFGQIYRRLFYMGRLMIRTCQGRKGFQLHFPAIWTMQIWKSSPSSGIFTWQNPDHSIELRKDVSLRLIVKRFQRLCYVYFFTCLPWHLEYSFFIWKVNTRNRELNLRMTCYLHNMTHHFFFFNILSGDLHFDVLIIGLC